MLPSKVLYANAIARDDSSDSTTDGRGAGRGVGSGTDLREREFARNSLRVDSEEVERREGRQRSKRQLARKGNLKGELLRLFKRSLNRKRRLDLGRFCRCSMPTKEPNSANRSIRRTAKRASEMATCKLSRGSPPSLCRIRRRRLASWLVGWSLYVFLATLVRSLSLYCSPSGVCPLSRSLCLSVRRSGAEAAKSRWKQQINGGRRRRRRGRAREGA